MNSSFISIILVSHFRHLCILGIEFKSYFIEEISDKVIPKCVFNISGWGEIYEIFKIYIFVLDGTRGV